MCIKPIEVKLNTTYTCPVCGEECETLDDAIKCSETKPKQHEYQVGDVVRYEFWPGDYKERQCGIIKECKYEDKHKEIPYYTVNNWHENFYPREIIEFIMTNEERINQYNEMKEAFEKEPEWDSDEGYYNCTMCPWDIKGEK